MNKLGITRLLLLSQMIIENIFFRLSRTSLQSAKGQIISKCLFGVFNFFQKTNTTRRTLVKTNSFFHFLEEFTAWQFACEINWPLECNLTFLDSNFMCDFIKTQPPATFIFLWQRFFVTSGGAKCDIPKNTTSFIFC